MARSPLPVVSIPRLWPGGTIACLATGPSLCQADVDLLRGRVDAVIAVSNAVDLAPWADVLYSCDGKWWHWRDGVPTFAGRKYAMRDDARRFPDVQIVGKGSSKGLSLDPSRVNHGHNSGYQAINLAVLFGATKILLLGYDMHGSHFFGHHPDRSKPPFLLCLQMFPTLVAPLQAAGVSVLNCTRQTSLTCFPRVPLEQALGMQALEPAC